MRFLKKWTSCIFSFIAGVITLALSACSGMVTSNILAGKSTTKAFEVITDTDLLKTAEQLGVESKFATMKAFSIILMVVAVLLLVYSIILLLKNLNVIKSKSKALDIVGWTLVALFLLSTIAVLVSSNVYADAMMATTTGRMLQLSAKVGFYQPFMLGTGIVLAIITTVFALLKRKDA